MFPLFYLVVSGYNEDRKQAFVQSACFGCNDIANISSVDFTNILSYINNNYFPDFLI